VFFNISSEDKPRHLQGECKINDKCNPKATAVKRNGEMKAHHACCRLEQHQQSRTGEERMLPSTLSTASVEFGSMQIVIDQHSS